MAAVKSMVMYINKRLETNHGLASMLKRLAIGLGAAALVAGCAPDPEGDGSGSGFVSGLEMATTMSVVAPTGGFNASPAPFKSPDLSIKELKGIINQVISGQVFDPESDFEKDIVSVGVAEDANESLEFVNFLLCFIDQTRMSDLVNAGAYTVFLNPTACLPDLDDVGFFRAVVESKRAFEHSPQFVNVWVPFADFLGSDYGGGLVLETIIYAEASAANPVGQFEMKLSLEVTAPMGEDFDLPPLIMNTRTVQRSDGRVEFISFFESGDPFVQEYDRYQLGSANVVMDDGQGNSGASVSFNRELDVRCEMDVPPYDPIDPCVIDTEQEGYEVVYNDTHLYRRTTGILNPTPVEACFDRTNPYYEVDDYGIYYEQDGVVNGTPVTAGQRVGADKQFGFEYAGQGGWASSYGINWYSGDNTVLLPDQATITSTDLVPQDYVVHRSEGEMSRYIGRTVPVASMPGAIFSYYGNYPGNPAGIASWDGAGRQASDFGFDRWRVAINPATFNFEIVGGLTQDPVTYDDVLSPVVVPAAITNQPVDSAGTPYPGSYPLRLQAVYTTMEYDHSITNDPAIGDVTYRGRYERIFPWHSDIYTAPVTTNTLYCFSNCLIGGNFAPLPATTLYYPSFNTAAPSAANITAAVNLPATEGGLRTYDLITTDGKTYRLRDNTNMQDVELLDTSAVTFTSRSMWGMRDTPFPPTSMFHPTLNNVAGLISATNLPELKSGQAEYTWETGTRDYNKAYTISKNTASDPVEPFNELLQFFYQHDIADDINDALDFPQAESWDNLVTVFDTYDSDLYANVPRFDWPYTSSQNWGVNAVNMTKGVLLTDFDGINYVVKPVRLEQLLIEYLNAGVPDTVPCTNAGIDLDRAKNELQLPTADSVNPITIDFSDIPIPVNTPPKVIDGVIL